MDLFITYAYIHEYIDIPIMYKIYFEYPLSVFEKCKSIFYHVSKNRYLQIEDVVMDIIKFNNIVLTDNNIKNDPDIKEFLSLTNDTSNPIYFETAIDDNWIAEFRFTSL